MSSRRLWVQSTDWKVKVNLGKPGGNDTVPISVWHGGGLRGGLLSVVALVQCPFNEARDP